tara:strand:+ start:30 stop:293 length:264 start_codon:yes stop_codon:yes gene_type:complete
MPINPESVKIGSLVRVQEGSYFSWEYQKYSHVSFASIGVVLQIFRYNENSYPFTILGYEFLAEVFIDGHRFIDVPNFKLYEVGDENL